MMEGKNQLPSPSQMVQMLRRKITVPEASWAMKKIQELGVLKKDEMGVYRACNVEVKAAQKSSFAIQNYHKQMIQRGIESITEQSPQVRELQALTLQFSMDRLLEAKAYLQRVSQDFSQRFHDPDSNQIYQLNIQLFGHTKNEEGHEPC